MKYKRILLKLSGEALMGHKGYGIDKQALDLYAKEIKSISDCNVQIAIVIGGGNIYRGLDAEKNNLDRVQGDSMGMLATVINSLAVQDALEQLGTHTRLMSSIKMEQVCETFIRRRAIRHLEKGRVVLFGAGTGNPYFTTDTAAALRAVEIKAEVLIKGTRVNGIYDKDPELFSDAKKYVSLTFKNVYQKNLRVMDMTAFTLCEENHIPIVVFDMLKKGNLLRILRGDNIGTLVE